MFCGSCGHGGLVLIGNKSRPTLFRAACLLTALRDEIPASGFDILRRTGTAMAKEGPPVFYGIDRYVVMPDLFRELSAMPAAWFEGLLHPRSTAEPDPARISRSLRSAVAGTGHVRVSVRLPPSGIRASSVSTVDAVFPMIPATRCRWTSFAGVEFGLVDFGLVADVSC